MRNEQGFYEIEKALTIIDKSAEWACNPVKTIREEMIILKKYVAYTDDILKKLSARNKQIADLKHRLEEAIKDKEQIYDIINDDKIDTEETISKISQIVSDN
jgi:hypothetical protein